jgi:hypothetical protein
MVHAEALRQYNEIQTALRDERVQCVEDRRFATLAGAQWEGRLAEQFANKPRFEVNKVRLGCMRIINEERANPVDVKFIPRDGEADDDADLCNKLLRADEQDSCADEAYDNSNDEAVLGGFGAYRLRADYEDETDEDDDRQRIRIEPINDADQSVWFDLDSKRMDKADAAFCFVVTSSTRDAYKKQWGESPSDWPSTVRNYVGDWVQGNMVHTAEYYVVEKVTTTISFWRHIDGSEGKYEQHELEEDDGALLKQLEATGSRELRQRKVKRKKVHKYILSGGGILEDCGRIAGTEIPIVPVYGLRWFIDGIERVAGHVRGAKDAQRLKNMQLSKLAEISALSSVSKPIFTSEQMAGHQGIWARDNIENYPYLLVNPITGVDGNPVPAGPIAYTKPADLPPTLATLLQVTEQDMQELLGNGQNAERIVSNVSSKTVEMVQNQIDMQTFIYASNAAKARKRGGEIWLSMARELYTEKGRKMKAIGEDGKQTTVELRTPKGLDENGEVLEAHNLENVKFDVVATTGPSSQSRRASTVRALTQMLSITQDPATADVLTSMAMMNMDGEGVADVRDYFRQKMVRAGVVKPTDEEAQQMQAEASQKQEDPQATALKGMAEEAVAKAAKARADVVETAANTELIRARTAEVKANTLGSLGDMERMNDGGGLR